jgi:hypothetical protein
MRKHLAPAAVFLSCVFALAACGDDGAADVPDPGVTLPGVGAGGDGFDHPTGADDVVISYVEAGGFTTREFAFQQTPHLLVSGDGRAFSPGMQIAIYPGPLLPAVQVQTITDEGIQRLLAAADEAGLLADVDYEQPTNIADASTATVTINVDGETWVHEAYALGLESPEGTETSAEREALFGFVQLLGDLSTAAGAENVGETELFEPAEYAIEALVVDDLSVYASDDGIEPRIEEWPTALPVRLADASTCTVVPASEIGETLLAADQLTFFTEGDVTYQVLARPVLPGRGC